LEFAASESVLVPCHLCLVAAGSKEAL
jgi:hypothetical protein